MLETKPNLKVDKQSLSGFQTILGLKSNHYYGACTSNGDASKVEIYNNLEVVYTSDLIGGLGNWLWAETNSRIVVPIGPSKKYFLSIVAGIINGVREFNVALVSFQTRNSCVVTQHYNCLGGYWYTPEHEIPLYVLKYMQQREYRNILKFIREYNREKL